MTLHDKTTSETCVFLRDRVQPQCAQVPLGDANLWKLEMQKWWLGPESNRDTRIFSPSFLLWRLTAADNRRITATAISMARRRNLIVDLPSGTGISKSRSGRGTLFYRVRFGTRFTGGP